MVPPDDEPHADSALTDIAFSDAVKSVQRTLGSRQANAQLAASGRWLDVITGDLARFIAGMDSLQGSDGERAIEFTVRTWDVNCKQYLPELYRHATVAQATAELTARIQELERELARLAGDGRGDE